LIDKILEVYWSLKLEALTDEFSIELIPVCDCSVAFEGNKEITFSFQIGDKYELLDNPNNVSREVLYKIIERISNPIRFELSKMMGKVEQIISEGSFEKDYWDKFWTDNIMNK